jgi:hypothetical protein
MGGRSSVNFMLSGLDSRDEEVGNEEVEHIEVRYGIDQRCSAYIAEKSIVRAYYDQHNELTLLTNSCQLIQMKEPMRTWRRELGLVTQNRLEVS